MNITFLGGGNMATALIGGLIAAPGKPDISVIDPAPEQRGRLVRDFGVRAFAQGGDAPACDLLVLAVKPQQMRAALAPMAGKVDDALVLSVAAGIRAADISRWLGGHRRLVRTMPNTPALIGAGITGLWADDSVSAQDKALAERIVRTVGDAVWVTQETMLDAVTAVSGSGPAYVFLFMEALHAAGMQLGLDEAGAKALTLATFRGAAALASQATVPLSTLREQVTSKGGTTAAALSVMAQREIPAAIGAAVEAACRRSVELADEFGRDPAG